MFGKTAKYAEAFLKQSQKVDVDIGLAEPEPSVDVGIGEAAIQPNPPCPNCAGKMSYNNSKGIFFCPSCGHIDKQ